MVRKNKRTTSGQSSPIESRDAPLSAEVLALKEHIENFDYAAWLERRRKINKCKTSLPETLYFDVYAILNRYDLCTIRDLLSALKERHFPRKYGFYMDSEYREDTSARVSLYVAGLIEANLIKASRRKGAPRKRESTTDIKRRKYLDDLNSDAFWNESNIKIFEELVAYALNYKPVSRYLVHCSFD